MNKTVLEKADTSLESGRQLIRDVVKTLPNKPGVYRMIGKDDRLLYVGKAKDLKKRVVSYTHIEKLPNRHRRMVSQTHRMEIIITHSEVEALLLESNLIKKLKPQYNILLKDDKSFPYILLTKNHDFPRLIKYRGKQTIPGRYYGPFASISAVDDCLITLQKVFLIRNCTDAFFNTRKRPCLQYHIKRCTAPCVGKVSADDYQDQVDQASAYLAGRSGHVQQVLAAKMTVASEALNYEEAAFFRDRLRLLTRLQAQQRINVSDVQNADIIAIAHKANLTCVQIFFFREGQNFGTTSFFLDHADEYKTSDQLEAFILQFYEERPPADHLFLSEKIKNEQLLKEAFLKKFGVPVKFIVPKRGVRSKLVDHAYTNALEALDRKFSETASTQRLMDEVKDLFQLPHRPNRIEIYDNSHLQGTNPYGVMVVANPQGFYKKAYRKFSIKSVHVGDDFAMMREVMERRFAHKNEALWELPDLMLIDGGMGQLNAVLEVMTQKNITLPVVGIAKGIDRHAGRERFFMHQKKPFSLPLNSPVLQFLQRLRDEAHRFAIGTHRAGRQKQLVRSQLDDIGGVGPHRKRALLNFFGSVQSIKSASLQDLQTAPGINKAVATLVYAYFHDG